MFTACPLDMGCGPADLLNSWYHRLATESLAYVTRKNMAIGFYAQPTQNGDIN